MKMNRPQALKKSSIPSLMKINKNHKLTIQSGADNSLRPERRNKMKTQKELLKQVLDYARAVRQKYLPDVKDEDLCDNELWDEIIKD